MGRDKGENAEEKGRKIKIKGKWNLIYATRRKLNAKHVFVE